MRLVIVLKLFFRKIQYFGKRRFLQIFFSAVFILFLLTGCITVNDTLYLKQAEIDEAINIPPIHLTDSVETPAVYFSPRFTIQTKDKFTGEIDQISYNYASDTVFIPAEHSLVWNMATHNIGFDFDIIASSNFAFSLGINFTSQRNSTSVGGYTGIGFLGYGRGSAFRFDAGLQLHTVRYDVYTEVVRRIASLWENDTYIYYYHDIGKSTHINPYFNITYNTTFRDWPFNIFVNAGYSVQSLFSFKPRTIYFPTIIVNYSQTDQRGESIAGFVHATPGIFFYLGEFSRLLLGARFFYEIQINGTDEKVIVLPMVQIDMHL